MSENTVLNVLMVVFRELGEDASIQTLELSTGLVKKLEELGFSKQIISQAFDWVCSLRMSKDQVELFAEPAEQSIRVFSDYENLLLDMESRSYLMDLRHRGILDSITFELVVDKLVALEYVGLGLSSVKWVTMLVLFNQPEIEQNCDMAILLAMEEISARVN